MAGVVKLLVGSVLGLAGAFGALYLALSLWQSAGLDPDSTPDAAGEVADVNDDLADRTEPSVVIDVFSGRPNPEFTLSDAEVEQLDELLATVVETEPGDYGDPPSTLDFRSFRVQSGWLAGDGIVTAKVIWAADGTAYADPEHLVYEFLRDAAIAKLDGVEEMVPSTP